MILKGVLRAKISDFGLSEFANFVKDDKKSSVFVKHVDGARQYQAPELQANPKVFKKNNTLAYPTFISFSSLNYATYTHSV